MTGFTGMSQFDDVILPNSSIISQNNAQFKANPMNPQVRPKNVSKLDINTINDDKYQQLQIMLLSGGNAGNQSQKQGVQNFRPLANANPQQNLQGQVQPNVNTIGTNYNQSNQSSSYFKQLLLHQQQQSTLPVPEMKSQKKRRLSVQNIDKNKMRTGG